MALLGTSPQDVEKIVKDAVNAATIEVNTQIKLLREETEKMKSSLHTMTKHIKFLVHMVKIVNPDLSEPE